MSEDSAAKDLHLDVGPMFDRSYERVTAALKSDKIRPSANSFARNMGRVAAISEIVQSAVEEGIRTQLRWDYACFKVLGSLGIAPPDHSKLKEIEAEIERLKGVPTDYQRNCRPLAVGELLIDQLAQQADPRVRDAIQGIFAAQIIGAWTAFEELSVDLWVRSLNACPTTLAVPVMERDVPKASQLKKSEREGSDEDEEDEDVPEEGKSLPFYKLIRSGFDLRDKMGALLKPRFRFNRLSGINRAYSISFGKFLNEYRQRQIDSLGKDAADFFEKGQDEAIETLYALRNVLVHKGGIVDQNFIDRIGHSNALFPSVKDQLGEPITLNGVIAHALTNVVSNRGVLMLWMADHVLTTHPEKAKME